MPASLSAVARRFSFVRETLGANVGYFVSLFQRFAGGVSGEPWCADFESFIEDIAYMGKAPLPKTGSCQVKLDYARRKGWVVEEPQVDDLFFYVTDAGHAHHVGIVTNPYPRLAGIAGNTSEDGTSSNGDGVHEHALSVPRSRVVFVRLPR